PGSAHQPGCQVVDDVAIEIGHHQHIKLVWVLHQLVNETSRGSMWESNTIWALAHTHTHTHTHTHSVFTLRALWHTLRQSWCVYLYMDTHNTKTSTFSSGAHIQQGVCPDVSLRQA